ncbi:hypothetical protein DEO72_LG8g2201 [Vigna unguiculata]|uniref:Uncharacterized protein n=1 Tax=Vigna unguiculata TaxID=3917 RepID=A0A4D6MSW5_VIGUN|nr:hypothetical protein DEO72_LG8g2201 [Vigna unguiculata]
MELLLCKSHLTILLVKCLEKNIQVGCVQELKIEVQELKNQIETKDGNMKTMATLLAQLLRHSSMTVPAELLDVIQQQSSSDHPCSSNANTSLYLIITLKFVFYLLLYF